MYSYIISSSSAECEGACINIYVSDVVDDIHTAAHGISAIPEIAIK